MMMLSALAIENVGRRNGVSFKTGMVEKKLRSKNTSAPTIDIHATVATVWSSNHWCRGPSSSTYCSEPRNTANEATCSQSIFFNMPRFGSSTLPSNGNAIAMNVPGTMLMKKSQCQLAVSVIHPPIVGPSVGASVDTRPRIAGTRARSLPVNSIKPVANTVGTIAPPTKPWIARKQRHGLDRPRQAAHQARERERHRARREQPACRHRLGKERRQWNHHDLCHQVGGLHPGDFVRAGRQTGLDGV